MPRPDSAQCRFRCSFPGCDLSYQRKEHLNRHQAQHRGSLTSTCPTCDRVFSRNDALRRHIRRDHKASPSPSSRATQACRACRAAKVRCRGGFPCNRCRSQANTCVVNHGTVVEESTHLETHPDASSSATRISPDNTSQIDRYIQAYFADFHPRWPILHRGTFSVPHEPPLLVHAVLMIGLWVTGTPSAQQAAMDLHSRLGRVILEQMVSTWEIIHPIPLQDTSTSQWPIATYQGILLYLIFSCISLKTTTRPLDLSLNLPPSDTQILSSLVNACLQNNIFYYPTMLARYQDIDNVTCIWVGVEEIKRLGLAMYKISRLCGSRDQRECESGRAQSHLRLSDLQYPPPDSRHLWEAESNPALSRLLAERGKRTAPRHEQLDGRLEENWLSSCGRLLDGEELRWV
ncbi:hypothetical protein BJX99DRAFT_253686 [Aspergillus californicus]